MSPGPPRSEAKNHAYWDRVSDEYQGAHGAGLERDAMGWGVWRIAEAELGALGDVAGRDVLELGCGGAQWACGLAAAGARVVGLDLSRAQLRHARERTARLDRAVPLLQGSATAVPLADASFDVVMSDHGATTFADPHGVVPEVARLLRPGGRFAFAITSPIRDACWREADDAVGDRLVNDYFGLHEVEDAEQVCFQLPYGAWISLFARSGLVVEALHELRPREDATTSYEGFVPLDWARRYPAENLWVLRKR